MPNETASLPIEVCPAPRQAAALGLLFSGFPNDEPADRVAAVPAEAEAGRMSLAGLFVAVRQDEVVGVIWATLDAGRTGSLLPPEIAAGMPVELRSKLVAHGVEYCVNHGARLIQTLLTRGNDPTCWLENGFECAGDVLHMVSEASDFPRACPVCELEFVPYEPDDASRLAAIVERTYVETRDLPKLNGLRPIDEVLAGQRGIGAFDPARWLIVRHAGQDVGCLLLTDHPRQASWELVYMGLVPEARGHGWGTALVRQAQWLAGQAARERMILSVDALNEPALAAYRAAGFRVWQKQAVFLRFTE